MSSTTALLLPYQIGTDRPCDAPTTWCSFTAQAESLLNAIDTSLGRVTPSVPACMVRRRTPLVLAANTEVALTFESVVYDTDNMTQLQSGIAILPHRNGRYVLTLSLQATATFSAFGVTAGIQISYGPTIIAFGGATGASAVGVNTYGTTIGTGVNSDAWYHGSGFFEWDGTNPPGFGVLLTPVSGGTLGTVEMSAHWTTDRIT